MQCIEMLERLQAENKLHEGTIPASVFAAAITHFTARAVDEGQKASQSMEEGEHHVSLTHEDVESWGPRPRLMSSKFVRVRKIILLTDPGAIIYRKPIKTKETPNAKPDRYLNNDPCTEPWTNITTSCECGEDWARWAAFLNQFFIEHGKIMETCPDGRKRFPSHVSVIVVDNLNGSGADYAENEEKKDEDKRTSMTKFLNNVVQQAAITELMDLIDCFRSTVYCQTVPARHSGMPEEVDQIADHVQEKARKLNIATLDATQFWSSIKPFMGPASLAVKCSDNAGVTDENVVHWHHYETGETKALPYHWDRYLFRLACYMETCLIHESVKKKIFDMTVIGRLRDNIKSKAYELVLEDQGRTTSEIAESIIPTSKSSRRRVSYSEKETGGQGKGSAGRRRRC